MTVTNVFMIVRVRSHAHYTRRRNKLLDRYKVKTGDRIRCIDRGNNSGITTGKFYKVVKIYDDMVSVGTDRGGTSLYFSRRFVLANNPCSECVYDCKRKDGVSCELFEVAKDET